jgi:hypothetical protein
MVEMESRIMGKDDVTKRFKPVWNLPLAVERNIDQQGMEKLQELYNALGSVLEYPHRYPDPVATVERLEYALQNTWKFEEDSKMHRYWNQIKGCTCPKDDNFLALGTGVRYYNSSCKWHGVSNENE